MMGIRAVWRIFKANRWARSHANGKRFQYTLHLWLIGDPQGRANLAEWRAEFQKVMSYMWSVGPLAGIQSDPAGFEAIVGDLFDEALARLFMKTPNDAIPPAGALSELWDHVSQCVHDLLNRGCPAPC
jgi:hypothetical protein